ncbi:uncharacterized protein LOC110444622, partial [Mizuhopecten yessoensis]|uniref:uncharacterized protein LOC110444622 n=1 Tax=Mizuhopecten yessoensis TaxID=6573 RepID=UPI000B45B0AD
MSLILKLVSVLSVTVFVPSVCQREHAGVYVTLYPPMNVSFGYIGDKMAYVYWFPPPVYIHVNFTNTLGDPNEPAPGKTDTDSGTDIDTDTALNKQKDVSYRYNKDSDNSTDTSVSNVVDTSNNTLSAKVHNSSVATLDLSNVNSSSNQSENTTSGPSVASVITGPEQTNTSSGDYKATEHHQNLTIWTPWTPKYIKYNDSQEKQPLEKTDIVRFHDGHLLGYIVKWWPDET